MPLPFRRAIAASIRWGGFVFWCLVAGTAQADHWAFQPPNSVALPSQAKDAWAVNPIDAFLLEKLTREDGQASPPAPRAKWLRRLSFDLRGLPPSWEEVFQFQNEAHPQAHERAVDRWLASPSFGERMAQIWLDLARYADTTGYAADRPRTNWLYRDWVVDALNANLPFDQFSIEQLAGDMLPGASESQRIASGFHANAPQALADNIIVEEYRLRGVVDRANVTAQVWLGLTFGCAECHDHKFDPISTREYYQWMAYFNNVPHHGEDWDVEGPLMTVTREIEGRPVAVVARVMEEGPPRETFVHLRGDYRQRGERVHPALPAALARRESRSIKNRLDLARWLVDGSNPLTARVAVNRLWRMVWDLGLVETLEDFGRRGSTPSHPELLDWLAREFVRQGWDQKALLRAILSSAAYRQDSRLASGEKDLANRSYRRGPRHRLSAEELRDSALTLGGSLSRKVGGPSVFPPQPAGVGAFRLELAGEWKTSLGAEAHRRSVYTFWQRMSPFPALAILGTPSREVCVQRRSRMASPMQSLVTWNEPGFHEAVKSFAARILREEPAERLRFAFRESLSREPNPQEEERFTRFLQEEPSTGWELLAAVLMNLEEAQWKE